MQRRCIGAPTQLSPIQDAASLRPLAAQAPLSALPMASSKLMLLIKGQVTAKGSESLH